MTEAELRRYLVALHEIGGHGVANYLLRGRVGLTSIRPCEHAGGFCTTGNLGLPPAQLDTVFNALSGKPLPLWPARERRALELAIMVDLAGGLAAHIYAPPLTDFVSSDPTEDEARAARYAEAFAGLPPKDREQVESFEGGPPTDSDGDSAWLLAETLDPDLPGPVLAYLRAATIQFLCTPRAQRLVNASTPVLLERSVLTGPEVRALFRTAEGGSTTKGNEK